MARREEEDGTYYSREGGAERVRDESSTYVARYRNGDGVVVEVSTGYRDKSAASERNADQTVVEMSSTIGPTYLPRMSEERQR